MDKKISACVIIYDTVTQQILGEHPTGRKWIKKDGSPEKEVFSLPKGEIEEDEEPKEAAIREIKEETNIDLDSEKLLYLGKYKYIKYKDLEMFFYPISNNEINLENCYCSSFFTDKNGKEFPEVNGFAWFHIEKDLDYFFKAQQDIIKQVQKEFSYLFNLSN